MRFCLFMVLLVFVTTTSLSQNQFVNRIADNTTAIISTHGDADEGVYSADYFELVSNTFLAVFRFPGFTTSMNPLENTLIGVDMFLYEDAGGIPSGDPTQMDSGLLELVNIQKDAGFEILENNGNPLNFEIYTTEANNGNLVILPPGGYWVVFAPFVAGGSDGDSRWNWSGSLSGNPLYEPKIIDSGDVFEMGVTEWSTISEVIDADFPSFAWVGIEESLGVSENILSNLSLYPNPAKDTVKILNPSSYTITSVQVTNVMGANVPITFDEGRLDVSQLSAGVYMVQIKTSIGETHKKLVVR